jgi:predicted DsbA family dithiol-disulfide isomerase
MVASLESRIRMLAEEIELEMKMPEMLSNSRLALQGAEFASEAGKADEYHESVFTAYFQEASDIGDVETLLDIAEGIGLDRDSFQSSLDSGEHFPALRDSVRKAHSMGLSGVPSFVFDERNVVVGAQPYETLKAVAEKSLESNP